MYDQFWAETEEIRHFHAIDETLSKQLMGDNLEIKEPTEFFENLVNNLRKEVD